MFAEATYEANSGLFYMLLILPTALIFLIVLARVIQKIRKVPDEIPRFFYEIEGLDIWNRDEDIDSISGNEVIFFVDEHGKVTHYDIVGKKYKLWGRKPNEKFGIGSTRAEVEANAPKLSKTIGPKWKRNQGYSRYMKLLEPYSMPESEFGFYRVACGTYAEFEFAKNNIVTRIRIGGLR